MTGSDERLDGPPRWAHAGLTRAETARRSGDFDAPLQASGKVHTLA